MKPLYTPHDFENAKIFDVLPIKCYTCGTTSYKQKKIINEFIKYGKGSLKFCSKKCNTSNNTKESVSCKNCNIIFYKTPSQIKRTKNNFCSQSCATKYQNKNKTSGFNKSKIEFWLETKLIDLFPQISFNFNDRNTLGLELDIFLPQLKLAFEINGIFHYKPIFGEERLLRYQESDNKKASLCQQHDIALYPIDISDMKYFTPKKANTFLEQISTIINSHN